MDNCTIRTHRICRFGNDSFALSSDEAIWCLFFPLANFERALPFLTEHMFRFLHLTKLEMCIEDVLNNSFATCWRGPLLAHGIHESRLVTISNCHCCTTLHM